MPRPSRLDVRSLYRLSTVQAQAVTLRQLTDLGLSESGVAHRVRPEAGTWQRSLPGVVVLHRGTLSPETRVSAALLYVGEGACLTGLASLRRHGLRRLPDVSEVHVLVPHERRRLSVGFVRVERTRRMPGALLVHGAVCAPVARSLVDFARLVSDVDDVRAATAEAVQRRLCSTRSLVEELQDAQRRRTAGMRAVVREVIGGVRSVAEADFRRFLARRRLPTPLWNHDLYTSDGVFIGCPDAWFAEAGVAAEVDSREWHMDPVGWERTQRRRATFARHGVATIPVTPRRLYREPDALELDLRGAFSAAAARGRPDVVAVLRSQAA